MSQEREMRVNRTEFLQVLEMVRAGLSVSGIQEQSDHFIFTSGQIITFNSEVTCRVKSGLDQDFTAAVSAAAILKILPKLEEDEIVISEGDGEIFFQGNGKWFGVKSTPSIVLPIDKVEFPTDWFPLPPEFGEGLAIVQECAGKDAKKFVSTCIHLTPVGMEATDGYKVGRFSVKLPVSRNYLVKRDNIKSATPFGMSEMGETKDWIHLRNPSGLYYSCRRFLEDFPDVNRHLQIGPEAQKITLPKGLIEACERANVVTDEQADANEITVKVKSGKVRIVGKGVTARYIESREMEYDGPEFDFTIPPILLADIVKRYNVCQIGSDRLLVEGERFVFVSCIGVVED